MTGYTIRLATDADADAEDIRAIYAPVVERTAISFELEPPSVDEMRQRIRATLQGWPWLVCAAGRQALGYAYAGRHRTRPAYRWAVDVSVYVDAACRRQGVGRALVAALLAILRRQGYYLACAGIALPNPASTGLFEALGFRPAGVFQAVGYKLGAWHDVGWWQLDLLPRSGAPAAPLPLAAVQRLPEWESLLAAGLEPPHPGP